MTDNECVYCKTLAFFYLEPFMFKNIYIFNKVKICISANFILLLSYKQYYSIKSATFRWLHASDMYVLM